ncbi:unnamed protein product [Adineta steineri]|uniref:Uncharacterized protein n=1 Tax=Adineta steineri TaxID=433720 RepID=A0A815MV28_9BILA|nr:unnamed protein product [Adineta steineri]CAF3992113.1 unnamed protein product [Adineta steineri]
MPSTSRRTSRSRSSSSSSSSTSQSPSLFKQRHGNHRDGKKINLLTSFAADIERNKKINNNILVPQREEDKQNEIKVMDIDDANDDSEVIDLRTPVNEIVATSVLTLTDDVNHMSVITAAATCQTYYKYKTLREGDERQSILPAFPAATSKKQLHLLLANVPERMLNIEERGRRDSRKYRPPFLINGMPPSSILVNTGIPSFFWSIYEPLFRNLSEHLHVDMAIIDYNYTRLFRCVDLWRTEHIRRFKKELHEVTLDQKEFAIALEFYLQIDVDLFYMKTCSFREAIQDISNKYVFCTHDPRARHNMAECGNCGLCYPNYDVKKRRQRSVQFGPAQCHQFANKYQTILNCPCVSIAKNFKIAYPNVVKSDDTKSKDDMRLYRHSTECPSAIQMFLDENPIYWRFIPFSNDEVNQIDQSIAMASRDILDKDDLRKDKEIQKMLTNLPAPPPNYGFSQRQYHQQYSFFQTRKDQKTLFNKELDLYNAKIIAVLPEDASPVLRRVIEALFITHAETKLNSTGHLVSRNHTNAAVASPPDPVWCEGLVRRPIPTFSKTIDMIQPVSKRT